MTPRKEEPSLSGTSGKGRRGRPRVWADEAEKQRAHRTARRERLALLDELLDAMRNAHWEEPDLQAVINHGTDAEVLRVLIAYYRKRHWMLWR